MSYKQGNTLMTMLGSLFLRFLQSMKQNHISKNIAFSFSFSSFRVFAILERSAICFSSVDMYSLFFFLLLLAASRFRIMRKAFLSIFELT